MHCFPNSLMKVFVAIAAGWLVFTICRSFERFVKNWVWVGMATALAQILDKHLNPSCKVKLVFSSMVISFVLRLIVSRVRRYLRTKAWWDQKYFLPSILKRWSRAPSSEKFHRTDSEVIVTEVVEGTQDRDKSFDSPEQHLPEDDEEEEEEEDEDDDGDNLSIESLLGFEPIVRTKSFEDSMTDTKVVVADVPQPLNIPLWRLLGEDPLSTASVNVIGDVVSEGIAPSSKHDDESPEVLNRSALESVLGFDLSPLEGTSSSQRYHNAIFNRLVGNLTSAVHVAGPSSINGVQVWYPFPIQSSKAHSVFSSLANGCSFLNASSISVSQTVSFSFYCVLFLISRFYVYTFNLPGCLRS